MRNTLDRETSPYLLQHKDNPVHWQTWSAATLALARSHDKPILLSIGYAACHWCHVMAHESFEDPAIAALMNELYVSIKVDREERPDIDAIYMNALHLLGQQGGWPLTMFLTPAGEPFWGGTYFPPASRWGRPGFPDVLRQIHAIYTRERDKIAKNTTAIMGALLSAGRADRDVDAAAPTDELFIEAATRTLEHVDMLDGGLNGAPKFPQPQIFAFLWRAYARTGDEAFARAVTITLDRMCQGGIYDHVGGGFARYSTDAIWLVPHFEKMLYDNASLIALLTEVWRTTRAPLYAERVRETVGWLEREMIAENGAFAASLDADSEGEEGRFYVWSADEIERVLGADAALFMRAYDVTPAGNWEGRTILRRTPHAMSEAEERRLADCRARLLTERANRIRPGFDDKVLADWNGLMIAALADAGAAFAEPAWIARAETAFTAVVKSHGTPDDRLLHSFRSGSARHSGVLDDYANMAWAAIALFQVTGREPYLGQAVRWVGAVERHFADRDAGGFFYTADDAEALITRTRTAIDSATPAGNGMMARMYAALHHLTGEPRYAAAAERILTAFGPELRRNYLAVPTLYEAFDDVSRGLQVAVIDAGHDATALIAAVMGSPGPTRTLLRVASGATLPATHPARGKSAIDGKSTVYVCLGRTCSLPITEVAQVAKSLALDAVRSLGPS